MTAPSRVDDLRKRYHENPKRFFAPLANEYRKTGFLDRAILLCEKHLAEQPDNMNGLVVYGQCLFESGRHAEAAAPFEGALGVDPENLIALRHLGDIARLQGDAAAAQRWYERVLELDRRNEEVLELIEQVGGRLAPEPGSGPSAARNIVTVAPSVSVAPAGDSFAIMGNIELPSAPEPQQDPQREPQLESRSARPVPAPESSAPTVVRSSARALPPDSTAKTVEIPDPSRAPKRASLFDIKFDFGEGEMEIAPPPAPPAAPVAPAIEEAPVGSLIEPPVESVSLGGISRMEGLDAAEYGIEVLQLPDLEATEFRSGTVSPLAGLSSGTGFDDEEAAVAHDDPPSFSLDAEIPDATEGMLPPLMAEDPEPSTFESAGLEELSVAGEDEAPPAGTPRTFVTETMATLYLQQGFRDRAIDVYKQLIEQDPTDDGLRQRLAELEESERPSLGFEPTVEGTEPTDEAPPANAMLAEMSFDGVALATPSTPATPAPPSAPPAGSAGPTAREFLRAFAQRALTPMRTPSVGAPPDASSNAPASAPAGALDALFGSRVSPEDERAAHRLAAVGATSGPSGGSAMDSLFGEGPSAPVPEFLARHGVPRASDRLNFEKFFTPPTATEVASAPESAGAEAPSVEAPSVEAPSVEAPSASAEGVVIDEDAAPDEDDLDQFQGWLRGLSE